MAVTDLDALIERTKSSIEKIRSSILFHEQMRDKKASVLISHGIDLTDTEKAKWRNGQPVDAYIAICHYERLCSQIQNSEKKFAALQEKLEAYLAQQHEEEMFIISSQMHVFEEFFAIWKERIAEDFRRDVLSLDAFLKEVDEKRAVIHAEYHPNELKYIEEIRERERAANVDMDSCMRYLQSAFTQEVRSLHKEGLPGDPYFEATLDNMLSLEFQRKRKDLLHRCCKVVGSIKDSSDLRVDSHGAISGILVGDLGAAEIVTVYAGGKNVLCRHCRVAVKPISFTEIAAKEGSKKEHVS